MRTVWFRRERRIRDRGQREPQEAERLASTTLQFEDCGESITSLSDLLLSQMILEKCVDLANPALDSGAAARGYTDLGGNIFVFDIPIWVII